MCGIAGFVGALPADAARQRLVGMLASITHRGPDSLGGYFRGGCALGAARLSIVDLEGGAQPAISTDGNVGIVFNGEIFNYRKLRADLLAKGVLLNTHSEIETLLHLYMERGEEMVRDLNGQFAIAVWDKRRDRLILFRDPIGIRPLFWRRHEGGLAFGSEIKAIESYVGGTLSLDRIGLLQTMRFWTVVGDRSAFEGVRQVPPGHYLIWEGGRERLIRYWEWPFSDDVESLRLDSDDAYFEAFRDAFDNAVDRQRMADVEVASYLSGGIDSTVVAQRLATVNGGAKVRTFSVRFDDPGYDESDAQDAVVRNLGFEHKSLLVTRSMIAESFPEVVRHAETPLFRTAPAPLFALSKAVRESGIKVVTTGEGADEVLLGYDLFRETLIRRFWARNPDSKMRGRLFQKLYAYLPQYKNRRYIQLLLDFYRPTLRLDDDRHYAMAVRWGNNRALESYLDDGMKELAAAYDPVAELDSWLPGGYSAADDIERAQCIESQTLLANYLLSSQGDRMTMAHSVEGRYPYLDLEFIRFAARLPRGIKLRGLRDKYVLRHAYGEAIPEIARRRPKVAYQAPEMSAFVRNGALVEYVADLLSEDSLRAQGLFNPASIRQLVQKACSHGDVRHGFRENMMFVIAVSTSLLTTGLLAKQNGSAHNLKHVVRWVNGDG